MQFQQEGSSKPRLRQVLFWLLAVLVLGAALSLGLRPYLHAAGGAALGEVPLTISMSGWSTDMVYVRKDHPVTIRLTNLDTQFHTDGLGKHNFVLKEFGIEEVAEPGETIAFTFTPTEAGQFDFYCDICCGGMDNPFMYATLVVN